jgi:trehalose 6-phosphate synthase
VEKAKERLRPFLGEQTIVRVDRSEPSKNIIRGLRAWELLLERYPDLRGKVNFLQFLVPSRSELGVYQTYTDEIFELIESINDHFGNVEWQPVRVFYEENYPQAIAGMSLYDVLLVNPIIDGMNLVSKEGPLVNERDGVLVLSELAGSYEQLAEYALPVAPTDLEGTVRALYWALTMPPDERRRRADALRQIIQDEDITFWLERQFRDLMALDR